MALNFSGAVIDRIRLVDDKKESRIALGFVIEEMDVECEFEEGPISSIGAYLERYKGKQYGFIFDHNLKESKNYSSFNGAEIVSNLIRTGIPAILCTRFEDVKITEDIRRFRPNIPVMINPDDIHEPDAVKSYFQRCINEIRGDISPGRKSWRTMVRVVDVDDRGGEITSVDVIVPAWNRNRAIRILIEDVGPQLREKVRVGYRCHAKVNIGADGPNDLFLMDWED